MEWWNQRMVGFDLETTAPLPEEARIVTAAIALCGGGLPTETRTWLADPGVEIPEGASAVHGITTEKARAEGRPAKEVVLEVAAALNAAVDTAPLIIFNARYDLTVLDRELRRHWDGAACLGVAMLPGLAAAPVIDPFVIDKWLDRYRKGSRKLDAICANYGATLDVAHDAAFDAVAACRAAWVLGAKGRPIRRVRSAEERAELAQLVAVWESVRHDAKRLHAAQREWALAERVRFAEYKRSVGDYAEAERIGIECGWPILDLMPHELPALAA